LLVEGESDAWMASWEWRDGTVLAVPTGAGTRPMPLGEKEPVVIVFDGDRAGHEGARRWKEALGDRGIVVELPVGLDLSDCILGRMKVWEEIKALLSRSG